MRRPRREPARSQSRRPELITTASAAESGLPDSQADVVAFLESDEAFNGIRTERIDTHAASVFLIGGRALKLKRAVRFDYLDFSTADRRRAAKRRLEKFSRNGLQIVAELVV